MAASTPTTSDCDPGGAGRRARAARGRAGPPAAHPRGHALGRQQRRAQPGSAGALAQRDAPQRLVVVGQIARRRRCRWLHRHQLLGCCERASARSTERGWTRSPKRVLDPGQPDRRCVTSDRLPSAPRRSDSTSAVSLCARRGPGRAGSRPGRPSSSSAAAAAYQLGRENPNAGRGGRDRLALHPDPAHHLISHLDQVPGVQELRSGEGGIGHRLGPRIQRPGRPQRLLLGI